MSRYNKHSSPQTKKMKASDIFLLVWSILTLGSYYPAFWASGVIGASSFYIFSAFLVIWMGLVLKIRGKMVGLSKSFNKLYLTIAVFVFFKLIISFGDSEYIIWVIWLISFYLFLLTGYNAFEDKKLLMRYFIYFHILMLFFTTIGTFLYYAQMLPPRRLIPIGTNGTEQLADYILFYIKMRTNDYLDLGQMMRPAGWYDEPGSFGLVTILLAYYSRIHICKKWVEYSLLFGGFITISFAYIAAAILYFFLFITGKRGLIGAVVVSSLFYMLVFTMQWEDGSFGQAFYMFTVERSENVISGNDDRDFDTGKRAFLDNFIVGDTISNLSSNYPGVTHETIWFYLANFGLIGGVIMLLPIIHPMIASKRFSDKKFLLVLAVIIIQRPYMIIPLYLLILYFTFYSKSNYQVVKA